ncbi:MAG: hypothetical protein SVK08_12430 [Halobacteriota archaeon]|nr:hypothetical protein [Halobacteriota archaeon]
MDLVEMIALGGVVAALAAVGAGLFNLLMMGKLYDVKIAIVRFAVSIIAWLFSYISLMAIVSTSPDSYLIYTLCYTIVTYALTFSGVLLMIDMMFMIRERALRVRRLSHSNSRDGAKIRL